MQNIYPDSLGQPPENLPVIATEDRAVVPLPRIRAKVRPNVLAQREQLAAIVSNVFDDLCGSLTNAMKDHGIDIGPVRIPWRVLTNDQDAIEQLSRIAGIWVTAKVNTSQTG
jgi:hypothetical protein